MTEIKSDASLRGKVRAIASKHSINAQEVLQMYLFEHFLLRLEATEYKRNFILKGGLLISSFAGLTQRTTMDMDATVHGIPMDVDTVSRVISEICSAPCSDEMTYRFIKLTPIRKDTEYANWRAHIRVQYGRMDAPIKIDITTGDVIVPREVEHQYPLMFDEGHVSVMAYTLETVLAEKFHAIVSHGSAGTRARDFYDAHLLLTTRSEHIDLENLQKAFASTASQRDSLDIYQNYKERLEQVRHSARLRDEIWPNYIKDEPYAAGVSFDEAVDAVYELAAMAGLAGGAGYLRAHRTNDVDNIFDLSDKDAEAIMTPRIDKIRVVLENVGEETAAQA